MSRTKKNVHKNLRKIQTIFFHAHHNLKKWGKLPTDICCRRTYLLIFFWQWTSTVYRFDRPTYRTPPATTTSRCPCSTWRPSTDTRQEGIERKTAKGKNSNEFSRVKMAQGCQVLRTRKYHRIFAQYIKKCQSGIIWHFMAFLPLNKFWKMPFFPKMALKMPTWHFCMKIAKKNPQSFPSKDEQNSTEFLHSVSNEQRETLALNFDCLTFFNSGFSIFSFLF